MSSGSDTQRKARAERIEGAAEVVHDHWLRRCAGLLSQPTHAAATTAKIDGGAPSQWAPCAVDLAGYRKIRTFRPTYLVSSSKMRQRPVWSESGFGLIKKRSPAGRSHEHCFEHGLNAGMRLSDKERR